MSQAWQVMEMQHSRPAGIRVPSAHAKALCAGARLWHAQLQRWALTYFFFFLIDITARYFPFSREGKDAEDAFVPWWCWPLPASVTSTTSQ